MLKRYLLFFYTRNDTPFLCAGWSCFYNSYTKLTDAVKMCNNYNKCWIWQIVDTKSGKIVRTNEV